MTAYPGQTRTMLGQLCATLWDSKTRADVIQPGFKPGTAVTPLALRCSVLDHCATCEPLHRGEEGTSFSGIALNFNILYSFMYVLIQFRRFNILNIYLQILFTIVLFKCYANLCCNDTSTSPFSGWSGFWSLSKDNSYVRDGRMNPFLSVKRWCSFIGSCSPPTH